MNQFVNIAVPAANGAGAPVDVSKMGATKTIVVGGVVGGTTVTIEYSEDPTGAGPWAPLPNGSFQNPGRVTFDFAAHWLRAVTSSYMAGTPNADCGASGDGSAFVELSAVSADIGALPAVKTVVAAGAGIVEVSEDGTSWSQAFAFQAAGGQTLRVYGQFARWTGSGTVWMGGASDGPESGSQPFVPNTTTIIYARTGGSNTSGNGTLLNPYATFSRAILDVPNPIPAMARYIVDITGVQELLPADYALPAIKSSGYYGVTVDDLDYRVYTTQLVIRAQYTPFTGVPLADRTISALEVTSVVNDPVSTLITITTTKNYAAGALRGAIIQTGTSPKRTAMVYDNTAGPNSVLVLSNTSTNVAWAAGPFELKEQSATLTAQNVEESYTGVSFRHLDSFFVDGVKFRNADSDPFSYSVNCIQSSTPIFGACDIEGIYVGPGTQYFYPNSTMFRNKTIESEGQTELSFAGCVLQDMATLYTYDVEHISMGGCGVRNCAAIGARPIVLFTPAFTTVGAGSATKTSITTSQIDGSVADTDFGTPGYGVLVNAPSASLANLKINGCASDAIHCTNNSSAIVQDVTGAQLAGVGVFADMGSQVSMNAGVTVTGVAAGDGVKAGSLAAAAHAGVVVGAQQYDLQPADINTVATGARIFRV